MRYKKMLTRKLMLVIFIVSTNGTLVAAQNNGIQIEGDVINSGSGAINIIQNINKYEYTAQNLASLEDALFLLTQSSKLNTMARQIPMSYAYELNDAILLEIGGLKTSTSPNIRSIEFRDGELTYLLKDSEIALKNWVMKSDVDDIFDRYATNAISNPGMRIGNTGLILGVSSYGEISKYFGDSGCSPVTTFSDGYDLFNIECIESYKSFENYWFGTKLVDEPYTRAVGKQLMNSQYVPFRLIEVVGNFPCQRSMHDERAMWTESSASDINLRDFDGVFPSCAHNPNNSWFHN